MAEERLETLSETESLCPECLRRVPASREAVGSDVYLVKACPDHGLTRTIVWRGLPVPARWRLPGTTAPRGGEPAGRGCPFDCGLCSGHGQATCCALLEVTARCNLGCPVCFADAGEAERTEPDLPTIASWCRRLRETTDFCIVQLSGGEPTVRDDLPAVVETVRGSGFGQIQLNTNGLRLAAEGGYATRLREAGLSWVFLQFDGTRDRIHTALRGRPLLREKLRAVERCVAAGLGVVLVPTVVPGVNDGDVGATIALARSLSPGVRGVHFQPISYFGRYPEPPADERRLTLPELAAAIERQTGGLIRSEHLRPSGCESPQCSFHGNFVVMPDGGLRPLAPASSCCAPAPAAGGEARRSAAAVSRRWEAPPPEPPACGERRDELDEFLRRAAVHGFSVSAMAFQDVWSLDLERVRDCCVHVVAPEEGLVPFCLYNLTDRAGRGLHRRCPSR